MFSVNKFCIKFITYYTHFQTILNIFFSWKHFLNKNIKQKETPSYWKRATFDRTAAEFIVSKFFYECDSTFCLNFNMFLHCFKNQIYCKILYYTPTFILYHWKICYLKICKAFKKPYSLTSNDWIVVSL
jgi:hypothetical protein